MCGCLQGAIVAYFCGCISVEVEEVIDRFDQNPALPPLFLPHVDPDAPWNDLQSYDEQPRWSYSETNAPTVMTAFETRNGFSDELSVTRSLVQSCLASKRSEWLQRSRGIAPLHAPWTGKRRQTPVSLRCSTCSCRSDTGMFWEGKKQVDAAPCSDRTLLTTGLLHAWTVCGTKRCTPPRFAGR